MTVFHEYLLNIYLAIEICIVSVAASATVAFLVDLFVLGCIKKWTMRVMVASLAVAILMPSKDIVAKMLGW